MAADMIESSIQRYENVRDIIPFILLTLPVRCSGNGCCSSIYFVYYGNDNKKINRCQDVRCIRDPAEQGHPVGRHHLRAPLRDLLHGQRGARRQEPVPQALRRGRGRRGELQSKNI